MFKFISHSEKDTINFANELAHELNIGDIIVLTGDLGSGKTKFTQGVLRYFNLESDISSPTFTIVNEHITNTGLPIYHFDVYRLADIDEFYAIGGDEYFAQGICIIEWGEMLEGILPPHFLKISFSRDTQNENTSILNIEPHGERLTHIIERILNHANS